MKRTTAIFIFVVLVAVEARIHRQKRENINLVALSRPTSVLDGFDRAGYLNFTQTTSDSPVNSRAYYVGLEDGKYIGLIHEAQEIGANCDTTGKALASSYETGPTKPLIAISVFDFRLDQEVFGVGDYHASLIKDNRNTILDRVLVIHRVPSNLEIFFKEALENGHHQSSVVCGFVTLFEEPNGSASPEGL
ncbi:uncharacterized protein [Venturia canescens]|uniref:uncharacterized protein n=1 Tax=Venturia canescens TaxID=32260 RepID=UPI001C9CAB1F|nr:uncharacterized protein LOC122408947 [Venturia canescens]